jgi:hypothetical protein
MKRISTDKIVFLLFAAFIGFSVLCFPNEARAQVTTGTIIGEAKDTAEAIIPGVKVTAKNANTGLVRETITNEAGAYAFSNLPVGEYEITAERAGFKKLIIPKVVLQIDQKARVDITLTIGQVEETVTVEELLPGLKTESPDLGEVIEHKRVVDLPLNGRQFLQLALLSAGTSTFASGQSDTFTGQLQPNVPLISVGGMREIDNNYTLDGVTITDYWFGSLPISPSVEAIQEFKVESNLSGAGSAGFKAGAQVNITTVSGTNRFHGSAFEFIRNDVLDARNFFDGPKPPFRQNQFGFAVGGPVKKNRTFFFANYEGLRIRQAITRVSSVPTQQRRLGDFSGLAPIYDPATTDPVTGARTQFPGNIIPANRISPVSRSLLTFLALPNGPGQSFNLLSTPQKRSDDNQFTIRVDHNFARGDHAFVRYTQAIDDTLSPFIASSVFSIGAAPAPGYGADVRNKVRNVAIGLTHLFTPKLVNDFRLGYNRITGGFAPQNAGTNYCGQFQIQGCSQRPIDFALPFISTGIFSDFGDATVAPRRRENYFQLTDSMSYEYKKHSLNWGGEVLWVQFNPQLAISPDGNFSFNPFYTASAQGRLDGNAFADFLLGLPRTAVVGRGDINANFHSLNKHLFIQDIWRVKSNLTLNFGIRYEINPPPRDLNNRTANLDPNTFLFVLPVDGSGQPNTAGFLPGVLAKLNGRVTTATAAGVPNALAKTNYLNFAPRVGLAYSFNGQKTVLRAGYGIYFQQVTLNEIGRYAQNPPFFDINVVANNAANPQRIDTILTSTAAGSISGFIGDFNNPSPYIQQWTFNLQHQLSPNLTVEADYLGTKGTHLDLLYSLNQAILGPGAAAGRRPNQLIPSSFSYDTASGNSSYQSLILRVEKRLSQGLFFVANYTLSKSLDDVSSILNGRAERILPQNTYNRSTEWGPSVFDRRHRFNVSYGYDLPFGPGKHFLNSAGGFKAKLVGGWAIQGITTLYSGSHFTAFVSQDRSGSGDRVDIPNQIGDPNTGPQTPQQWFNTSAFVLQPLGTFGNAGRNSVVAPGYKTSDLSIVKNTILKERQSLQLRMEIFNLANHANFDLPNNIIDSPDFGRIFSAQPSRQIQFGVKYIF